MKWNFKKAISMFLITIMMLTFVACDQRDTVAEEGNASTTEVKRNSSVKEDKKDESPEEIETFSVLMFTEWYKKGWEAVEAEIEDNAESLGFKLEIEKIAGSQQGDQIMKTRFAAGEYPDFFEYQSAYDVEMKLGGRQQIQDISGDWVENFDSALLGSQFYSYDDTIVGMPIDPAVLVGTFYNKKVFEEVGVEVPTSWEELMAVCEEIKQAGKVPFYYPGKDTWALTMVLNEGFIREYAVTPEKELYEKLNSNQLHFSELELLKDALVKDKSIIDKGYVQPAFLSGTYDEEQKALANGDVAMIFQGTWVMDEINKKFPDQATDIGAFAIPFEDEGRSSQFAPFAFMMTAGCDKDAGMNVIEYLGSKDTQQLFADNQPGLWTCKGVTSDLLPAVADMKKWQDEGKVNIWYGNQFKYPSPPFDIYIQDYFAGGREVEEIFTAADIEYGKTAKASGDPNWK
ncbi:ABC transporter substrate-binding protein [Vallitalea okinawensis]|uniref:ABC transporter substrate-binding protein n=1 Tax=Vallitalea okinawensis TaxID=2078660 RepID=UPI000CFE0D00|nr:ABC transporter substrate-binding protein [Vallitalea okinawensis]